MSQLVSHSDRESDPWEAWQSLSNEERREQILANYNAEHWFDIACLPTLACFRRDAIQWGRIKATFKNIRGNPWDLEKAVDKLIKDHRAEHTAPEHVARTNGASPPLPTSATPYGDLFYAEWLQTLHGADLRYCPPWNKWLVWTGTHWERDSSGHVMEYARQTLRHLGHQAVEDDNTLLLKHYAKSLNHQPLTRMIAQASTLPGVTILPSQLDQHPWLLNCTNGTLDLRTGSLHAHCKEQYLTRCLTIAYDPQATAPTWQAFLWRIMGGTTPDTGEESAASLEDKARVDATATSLIAFFQRILGYACTGDTNEECLFLFHGTGRNGKSKLLNTIKTLLGPYAKTADMHSFLHKDRETVRNDLADLAGARFVCASETNERSRLAEGLIKQLTGSDMIKARFLFEEYFEFLPEFKLFLAFNRCPDIPDDQALWARIHRIPFDVFIPPEERDKKLGDKLCKELPGILAWMVQGCLAWQQTGLQPPDKVLASTQAYQVESDTVGQFLDERCLCDVHNPSLRTKARDLFDAYAQWCEQSHERPKTQNAFGRTLTEKGFVVEPGTRNVKERVGLKLHPVTQ